MNNRKHIFEIPENPDSVVCYPGRFIEVDGETIREIDRTSECAKELLSEWGMAYCKKHWFNPVFLYTRGSLPVLIGFIYEPTTKSPPTSSSHAIYAVASI